MPTRNLMLRSFGPGLEELKGRLSAVTLRAGQSLCEPGDHVERVFFPTSGLISARALLETGHQMECLPIGYTSAMGAVAAIGFIAPLTRNLCVVDGHAWTVSLPDLQAAMREVPIIEAQVRRFVYSQIAYLVQAGVCNAMHAAEQRIARWLLIAADLLDAPEVRLAQEELSNVLGLQRSAVSPILQRLRADGLIDLARGRIAIVDPQRLERRACECLRPLRRHMGLHQAANAPA